MSANLEKIFQKLTYNSKMGSQEGPKMKRISSLPSVKKNMIINIIKEKCINEMNKNKNITSLNDILNIESVIVNTFSNTFYVKEDIKENEFLALYRKDLEYLGQRLSKKIISSSRMVKKTEMYLKLMQKYKISELKDDNHIDTYLKEAVKLDKNSEELKISSILNSNPEYKYQNDMNM